MSTTDRTRWPGFGRLLKAAVVGWAAREDKDIEEVRGQLAAIVGRKAAAIESYMQGLSRPRRDKLEQLLQECTRHAYLNEQWKMDIQDAYYDPNWLPQGLLSPLGQAPVHCNRLPKTYRSFIERQPAYQCLVEMLKAEEPKVAIIYGISGVGKTSLVLGCAYRAVERRLDTQFAGVVWIDARDLAGIKLIETIYKEIAAAFKVPPNLQEDVAYRVLEQRRVLLFIDNAQANDTGLALWLRDLPKTSKAVVTYTANREALLGFRGRWVQQIKLEGMSKGEAEKLVEQVAAPLSGWLFNDPRWKDLLDVTAGNPKAIELAVGLLRENYSLDNLIHDLRTASGHSDEIFASLFQRSWAKIEKNDGVRKVMLAMSLFPGSAEHRALATIAGVSETALIPAIEQLQSLALIERVPDRPRNDRYRQHTLIRRFAEQRLGMAPAVEQHMRARWIEYYQAFLQEVLARDTPKESYWTALVGSQDLTKIDREWRNLEALLTWLLEHEYYVQLTKLLIWLAHYLDQRGLYSDRLGFAQRLTDERAVAKLKEATVPSDTALLRDIGLIWIDMLGWTRLTSNQFEEAEETIKQGAAWAQQLPPESPEAFELNVLAQTFLARLYQCWQLDTKVDQPPERKQELRELSDQYAAVIAAQMTARGDQFPAVLGQRVAMALGEHALSDKDYETAATYIHQSYDFMETYGGEAGVAFESEMLLGFIYLTQQRSDAAEQMFRDVKVDWGAIQAGWRLYGLACVAWMKGNNIEARSFITKALNSLDAIGIELRVHIRLQALSSWIDTGKKPEAGIEFIARDDLLFDIHRFRERYDWESTGNNL